MLVSPGPFKTHKNRESTSLFPYEMYGEGSAPKEFLFRLEVDNRVEMARRGEFSVP